jgi:hypothetical protein
MRDEAFASFSIKLYTVSLRLLFKAGRTFEALTVCRKDDRDIIAPITPCSLLVDGDIAPFAQPDYETGKRRIRTLLAQISARESLRARSGEFRSRNSSNLSAG